MAEMAIEKRIMTQLYCDTDRDGRDAAAYGAMAETHDKELHNLRPRAGEIGAVFAARSVAADRAGLDPDCNGWQLR